MSESRKLLDSWLPPEGAGRAVACLATSFTFDPDFFEEDCLGRFLSLDWRRGEGDDLAFLIEQEERLAETRVSVLVDRGYNPEARSLRWDILPIPVRGGVQHAKAAVLVWERALRVVVGSANLTPAGYRSQVEAALVLDAADACGVPEAVFIELFGALGRLVDRAPGNPSQPGPKLRAQQTLDTARERIRLLQLPRAFAGRLRARVVEGTPGLPVLPRLRDVWRGGPPRHATVLSPFFDTAQGPNVPAQALAAEMAKRGPSTAAFVVPVEGVGARPLVRAPRSILDSLPSRIESEFYEFAQPDDSETRRLHAKAIVLESNTWTAALIGSSNFTSAGLGLLANTGNLEINVAFGAPADSPEAKALRSLVRLDDPLALEDVDWEPEADEEESSDAELPLGFVQCLLEPPPNPELILELDPGDLPSRWRVRLPEGHEIADHGLHERRRRPASLAVPVSDQRLPFFVVVEWEAGDEPRSSGWPVNVSEPGRLPPPEELRDLPIEALLRALASTRPMHEALTAALRAHDGNGTDPDLDPLKRYSSAGQLFVRTRRLSAALDGLRQRLERPAANADALLWRLKGPFGPTVVAEGLIRDLQKSTRAIEGEASFLLAELALTLARVDWTSTARILPISLVRCRAREVLTDVRDLAEGHMPADPRLRGYVSRALAEARL